MEMVKVSYPVFIMVINCFSIKTKKLGYSAGHIAQSRFHNQNCSVLFRELLSFGCTPLNAAEEMAHFLFWLAHSDGISLTEGSLYGSFVMTQGRACTETPKLALYALALELKAVEPLLVWAQH